MVSALAMAGGLFYTSCGNDVNDLEAGKPAENAAVLIGDVAIPPSQIDSQIQQMAQQFGQSFILVGRWSTLFRAPSESLHVQCSDLYPLSPRPWEYFPPRMLPIPLPTTISFFLDAMTFIRKGWTYFCGDMPPRSARDLLSPLL